MTFHTNDLLSKWGFGDGDMLTDLLLDNNLEVPYSAERMRYDHVVLIEVVKTHVIPRIDASIVAVEYGSLHNPIRASEVNGKEVDWFKYNEGIRLSPETVEVDDADILAIARRIKTDWEAK